MRVARLAGDLQGLTSATRDLISGAGAKEGRIFEVLNFIHYCYTEGFKPIHARANSCNSIEGSKIHTYTSTRYTISPQDTRCAYSIVRPLRAITEKKYYSLHRFRHLLFLRLVVNLNIMANTNSIRIVHPMIILLRRDRVCSHHGLTLSEALALLELTVEK